MRTAQCFCGAVIKTPKRDEWLFWLDNHHCPGTPEVSADETSEVGEQLQIVHGDAQVERSYQWNGRYDGEYQYTPEINARQPMGFQVE